MGKVREHKEKDLGDLLSQNFPSKNYKYNFLPHRISKITYEPFTALEKMHRKRVHSSSLLKK